MLARRLLFIAVVATLLGSGPAKAATFRTTTLADGEDAAPGDGLCATDDGECTARAALTEAALQPDSEVRLLPGLHALELGPLSLPWRTRLVGAGRDVTVLDAQGASEVLWGQGGEVSDLELRGATGAAVGNGDSIVTRCRIVDCGAGVWTSFQRVIVRDSEILDTDGWAVEASECIVEGSRLMRNGGGLSCFGPRLSASIVSENRGTGVLGRGETLEVSGSTIADNDGAGVRLEGRIAMIEDSLITGNGAETGGPQALTAGGVLAPRTDCRPDGTVVLIRSQVRDNDLLDLRASADADLAQSHVGTLTLGVNDACGMSIPCSRARISNSTVEALNTCSLEATHATLGEVVSSEAVLNNSVLLTCSTGLRAGAGNFSPVGCIIAGTDNLQGPDPMLGPLQDNGSGRWSRLPLLGSPLIGAADSSATLPEDQIGRPRPIDFDGDGSALPDIGAIEACPDTDGDGACDALDCAPADPGVWRTPEEADLRVGRRPGGDELRLSWEAVTGADSYEIARGSLTELWSSGELRTTREGTVLADEFLGPMGPGSALFLVRSWNACGGTWGSGTLARERPDCS